MNRLIKVIPMVSQLNPKIPYNVTRNYQIYLLRLKMSRQLTGILAMKKNTFRSERSDIIEKSWYSLARLSADIFSLSNRLSSLYYEQCLQYEKAWGYYWTETFKSFNTFYQSDGSHKRDII